MAGRIYHADARRFIDEATGHYRTEWFEGHTRPGRTGWYHVVSGNIPNACRYWDAASSLWMLRAESNMEEDVSSFQNWIWRGLEENPAQTDADIAREQTAEAIQKAAGKPMPLSIGVRIKRSKSY